ncbi:MAG: RNA polymerase sigma-70 factor [Bacteroidales bacterium]|jgi:RNA polymerase sigma-70 factor (ECF subfamily)|nr:RNA polymerase sigma-70 factor [Bacteroidales bacterium]
MDLEHLWNSIRKGDEAAFERLYEAFYTALCSYAFQLLHDRFLAEETVQDTFLKIWEKREQLFSKSNSLKIYLYQLVHNQCMDELKKQKTLKAGTVKLLPSEMWITLSEKYHFDEYLIEKLETEETFALIEKMVAKLPEQCRKIFRQSRMEEKTDKEIAETMGLSVNTVRTQIYRAIQRIRAEIFCLLISWILVK